MTALAGSLRRGLAPFVALVLLLIVWQLGATLLARSYLPTFVDVLPDLRELVGTGEIFPDLFHSLGRLAFGFALGVVVGIPVGLWSGRSAAVDRFVQPLLALFYPIPKAALIPIFMLWFGAGDFSKILIIFLSVSLPLVYHAYQGAKSVDEKLMWSAMAMGMKPGRLLFKVILPAALPEVLLGTRVAIVIGVIVMVTSEMIVRQNGIGNYLFTSLDMAQYNTTYAVIVIVGALGFLLDWAFETLRRRLTFWAPDRGQNDGLGL